MAYRVESGEEPVQTLRRVADEQISKALAELVELGPWEGGVHQARKRCKKVRALLRLARPGLGSTYGLENGRLREAARRVAFVRDAHAALETYEALGERFGDRVRAGAFDGVRAALLRRREERLGGHDLDSELAAFELGLQAAREAAGGWELDGDGAEVLLKGLKQSYRRGRKAMDAALHDASAEAWHEWRKRAKDHGYHLRLLAPVWPAVVGAASEQAGELSDRLGEDHDLAVLQDVLMHDAPEVGDAERAAFVGLCRGRSLELRAAAANLGRRQYAEGAGALRSRLRTYWHAWREATPGE